MSRAWTLLLLALATVATAAAPTRLSPMSPKQAPETTLAEWQKQRFGVLTTELSPAVVVHCRAEGLGFFRNLAQWGLGGPSFVAVPTAAGVGVLRRGEPVPTAMREAWLLCWFHGAEGWTRWDVPMLLVLQHLPSSIALADDGLTLRFPKQAGLVAVMPLYGFFKVPLGKETDYLANHGLPSKGLRTDAWAKGLPKTVVERCRYWAQALRRVPVHCREEFALDGDELVIRSTFTWLPIDDDWDTPPRRLAPLSPALALARWAGRHVAKKPFPMTLPDKLSDPDLFTPYGPYVGVEGADGHTVRMKVLRYIHEALEPEPPDLERHPAAAPVLQGLRLRLAGKFRTTKWQQTWDHGGPPNYCWQVMGDRWYAKVIPYLEPEMQERVKAVLRDYVAEFVLQEKHYKPFKGMLLLVGPGIGTWGGYNDAGKFSSNLLESLWNFAHYAGGWDVIKARWPMVLRFFITPLVCDWKSMGRYAIAEMGDEAAPPLALARMAHKVGDRDTYAFASYVFARELVHHYVKQVGAPYFRRHQPWHSDEFLPEEVYLTNMWGDLASWQIDGPTYPEHQRARQYNNRWVRFSCEEVARFYRDLFPTEVRAELDLLTQRAKGTQPVGTPYRLHKDAAHISASIVRLRAMLLGESPEHLLKLSPPAAWRGRAADLTAMRLPLLRNTRPAKWTQLIPPAKTDFTLGLERAIPSTRHATLALVCNAPTGNKVPEAVRDVPFLRWWGWPVPKPIKVRRWRAGTFWSFGQILPEGPRPTAAETQWLNWNTRLLSFGR